MARVEINGKVYDMYNEQAQELVADIYAAKQHVDNVCSNELIVALESKCKEYLIK